MANICALSTDNVLRGGLPRNNVDRINDRPDMALAVYRGRKSSTQKNKQMFAMLNFLNNVFFFYPQKYRYKFGLFSPSFNSGSSFSV